MRRILLLCLFVTLSLAIDMQRDTLSNGLVVITIEAHKIPVVEMKTITYAGSVFDPAGKEGIAYLTSEMLVRGTDQRSAEEIALIIESVAGQLTPFADEDGAGLTGKVLSKDLSLLIDVLSDCIKYPAFDSLELERAKRELVAHIKTEEDRPFSVTDREFRALLFDTHPLGHYAEGYDSTVARMTLVDVRNFYDGYYAPNNTFTVFVGDFNRDSLLVLLEKRMGDWSRKTIDRHEVEKPIATTRPLGKIVPMDISQAYIALGHHGPAYGDPEWYNARVMNYVLGGGGIPSRIYHKIRDEMGLAYIAYSYFRRFKTGGFFVAEVQTRKEMANTVVQTLIEEMTLMKEGATAEELNRAQRYYIGHFPLTFDTYREMASLAARIEIEGLGVEYFDTFTGMIEGVSLDDVKNAARAYLYPDRFYLLIVGDVNKEDITVEGIEWVE